MWLCPVNFGWSTFSSLLITNYFLNVIISLFHYFIFFYFTITTTNLIVLTELSFIWWLSSLLIIKTFLHLSIKFVDINFLCIYLYGDLWSFHCQFFKFIFQLCDYLWFNRWTLIKPWHLLPWLHFLFSAKNKKWSMHIWSFKMVQFTKEQLLEPAKQSMVKLVSDNF